MEFYRKKYESLSIALLCLLGVVLSLGNTWPAQQQLFGNLGVVLVFSMMLIGAYNKEIKKPSLGMLVGLFLLGFYLFSSIAWNKPSMDRNGIVCLNNMGWWMDYSKMCMVSFIAGVFCLAQNQRGALLFAFSGGAFLLPIAFTVYSIYLDGETKYGPIHNVLTGQIINSCGVMSLVVFLPVFYAAGIFNKIIKPNQKNLIILLLIYSIASVIGYLYNSRSVFIVIYILVTLMALFFYLQDRWRKISGLKIAYLVSALVLLILVLQRLERPVGLDVLKDVRFDAYFSFLQQFLSSPFAYAKVPLSFEQVASNHFHNFFADAHRLSGFWSFLSAVLLVGFIGIRVLQAAIKAPEGRMLLMVFIPVFLILSTSVVPEGEFQPILLILLLGGCAESILKETRFHTALEKHVG